MGEQQNEVRRVFIEALALSTPEDRSRYLDAACRDQPGLRLKVEALLRTNEKAGAFLNQDALGAPLDCNSPAISERPGTVIGHYKLLEQIGEGGFGVVFMAEQIEPIRRKVALKIVKPGMDTKEVIARFEAERQALALMDHPNIAHVYDAGATESGRPYFVMELVHGVPITRFCDDNGFTPEERLKLFMIVCEAVQHAHQKGIIHRDLKPSNILVTLHDGKPVPKVIDFGTAKALQQSLTDKTLFTAYGKFIGTPQYTSPEQAELGGVDVDTRSDIYSLGVLLYELLTGTTPFEVERLRSAAFEEMMRIIREEETPKPSTRVSTLGERATNVAKRRHVDPNLLQRSLKGDLDWIVMKALEKDRARRYETINELAQDIECHLNHQPVSAVAPTLGYRAVKCFRRHRRGVATAGMFALLLIVGTLFGVWQSRQAERERASLRNVRWALETAMPEIERSLDKDDCATAFRLVEQAQPFVGDNPRFQALSARVVGSISVETTPAGAQVFIRDYSDLSLEWKPLGKSPLYQVKVSQGFKRWKITLPGYEGAEGALPARYDPVNLKVKLDKAGTLPPGMVRIEGQISKPALRQIDGRAMPELNLPDFLLDRYEVSNRRYKEFVDAGGYQKPDYWKHKILKDGLQLGWQAAMKVFVDQTGQPGPATWKNGDFPAGQGDYPVAGVSWYEAAAYAEFAGKRLPTVYHWSLAAANPVYHEISFIIPLSNLGGKGLAPVGAFQGMTRQGVYDMAGNVKEWCFNEAPDHFRVMTGAAWNEPAYMSSFVDKYPPSWRAATFGFRCMKLLKDDGIWEQAIGSVPWAPSPVLGERKPCSDEVFQAYLKLYDYDKSELKPMIEGTEDLGIYTRREKVSFNTAYGNERMTAYLYLPRAGKPPFQTVIYFPGNNARMCNSFRDTDGMPDLFEKHTRNGRAFVIPVLQGDFERKSASAKQGETTGPEPGIMYVKDFMRTLDYLETRSDEFDTNKLAYEGMSRGARWGGILLAIETRIKVAVLVCGGLNLEMPPEYSQLNFAPRIKIPVLLQNGRWDSIYPVESSQRPFLGLFGTAEKDKELKIYEAGHDVYDLNEARKDEREFLDKYLGPVK